MLSPMIKSISFMVLFGFTITLIMSFFIKKDWKLIHGRGLLLSDQNISDMLFIDENNGFIVGTNWDQENFIENRLDSNNAVVFKTRNGGEIWEKKDLGKGEVKKIVKNDYALYTIVNNYSKDLILAKTRLLKSDDLGENWEEVYTFSLYMRDILFQDNIGVTIGRDLVINSPFWKIYYTTDYGNTWKYLYEIKSILNPILAKNELYFLDANEPNYIKFINLETQEKGEIDLGLMEIKYLALGNYPSFLGVVENKTMLGIIRNREVEFSSEIEIFKNNSIFEFSFSNDKIGLVIGKIEGFQTRKTFLYSEDSGLNWKEEKFQISNLVKNLCFLDSGKAWVYSGGNRIQVRSNN